MKQSPESKALAACRALFNARLAVKQITKQIGACLDACHDDYLSANPTAPFDWPPHKPHITHLSKAYAHDKDEDGSRDYLSDDEKLEILGECPHCKRADELIQERKSLRMDAGVAMRRVTMIGRSE